MKKMWLYFLTVVVIIGLGIAFVAFADDADYTNTEFLSGYGWIVTPRCVEKADVLLPETADDVYENYNRLQKEAGLSLEPYYGKRCTRYTYIVLNYPKKTDAEVRANVLCAEGVPIAGDIMTVSQDGFMHSLIYPE